MILGIGVDIVDVERFERSITRTPALIERLFAESERKIAPESLAARFAAKEALIKAVGTWPGFHFHDMAVAQDEHGRPFFETGGEIARVLESRGVTSLHLSLTHDGGLACAFVVAEGDRP